MAGELQGNVGVTVNVLNAPQWIELRSVIVTALEDHPEARQAVVQSLLAAGDAEAVDCEEVESVACEPDEQT